jgi:hypothetical protein
MRSVVLMMSVSVDGTSQDLTDTPACPCSPTCPMRCGSN